LSASGEASDHNELTKYRIMTQNGCFYKGNERSEWLVVIIKKTRLRGLSVNRYFKCKSASVGISDSTFAERAWSHALFSEFVISSSPQPTPPHIPRSKTYNDDSFKMETTAIEGNSKNVALKFYRVSTSFILSLIWFQSC